jgi:DNA mismatch endonuclease (patch repair protein)
VASREVPESRSRNMAAIRSRDTKIELTVRKALHVAGFRFRLHRKDLPGKPDVILPGLRTAVFVHGCFWHGHVCKEARRPKSNLRYWNPKIEGNMARDRRVQAEIKARGWVAFVVRECTVERDTKRLLGVLAARRGRDVRR